MHLSLLKYRNKINQLLTNHVLTLADKRKNCLIITTLWYDYKVASVYLIVCFMCEVIAVIVRQNVVLTKKSYLLIYVTLVPTVANNLLLLLTMLAVP